jgi:hypothetical protein
VKWGAFLNLILYSGWYDGSFSLEEGSTVYVQLYQKPGNVLTIFLAGYFYFFIFFYRFHEVMRIRLHRESLQNNLITILTRAWIFRISGTIPVFFFLPGTYSYNIIGFSV